jgi:putative resolvase
MIGSTEPPWANKASQASPTQAIFAISELHELRGILLMRMKLSDFAKKRGISYQTAWRWFKTGKFPAGVSAEQMPSGTVIVTEESSPQLPSAGLEVYLYARVSAPDQKKELDAQLGRLAAYAAAQGWSVAESVTEIGSGLSGHRHELMKLLSNPNARTILVERRDRLLRFGSEYLEAALAIQGRKIVLTELSDAKDEVTEDMVDVFASFCLRLYGEPPPRKRVRKVLSDLSRKSALQPKPE